MSTFNISSNFSSCSTDPDISEKCFSGLYQNRPSKFILIAVSILFSFANVVMSWGIIWYERFGSDNRRTLMNKLVSSVSIRMMEWMLVCQIGDAARYSLGPLPVFYCGFLAVVKSSVRLQVVLLTDAMFLTKYIFVFHLKNPSAVTEDFWATFINLLVSAFGNIFSTTLFFLDARKPLHFYACADIDMIPFINLPRRSYGQPEFFSFVLIIFIQARLYFHTAKVDKHHNSIYVHSKTKSLGNFKTTITSLVTMFLVSLSAIKINSMTQLTVNEYPNYLHMQLYQLLMPNLVAFVVTVVYYLGHPIFRNAFVQNIRDHFQLGSGYPVLS